ncbi:MAG: hypothetical protein NBV68_07315 [Erythrobacter sp.]|nr:hypothetical protein [Erythrobacter sp.]
MKAGKRIDADAFAQAPPSQRLRASGPWLRPFLAPFQRSSIEGLGSPDTGGVTLQKFEDSADEARLRLSGRASVASVTRAELEAAIAKAAAMLADPAAPGATPQQRSNMRHGLQMYGVHVEGDTRGDTATLRLANVDLPFSLRFIACSFAMPLSLSSAGMVTLDLSGCAVRGIDATFLRLSGSLRLRRLYASAPLDFTGARIHGFLDGADMVLQPFGRHPAAQAVSPERAMLGLNQVQIDNEIRLQRAQIWGGITMRGLEAKRSLYMNDAVVLCPLAVLEALAKGSVSPTRRPATDAMYHPPGWGRGKRRRTLTAAWRRATLLRGWSTEYANALAQFDPDDARWNASTLHALLTSNLRARTSAIRGDGIKIEGSVFMERLCSHGRLRMKYAQIAGGLTLAGSRLRSTEALMPTFDRLAYAPAGNIVAHEIAAYRETTYNDLVDPEDRNSGKLARGADIFALDLRESRIEGDVRIGITDEAVPDEAGWNTRIDGVVALDQAHFDGALRVERVQFSWSLRLLKLAIGETVASEQHYRAFENKGRDELKKALKANRKHQISARGLTAADTVNLCGSRALKGADFSNAVLGGDLLFWAKWAHPHEVENDETTPKNRKKLTLEAPAADLGGAAIELSGTAITGDLFVLFDPAPGQGPWLQAERVKVGGLLSIMPPPDADNAVVVDAEGHRDLVDKARVGRKMHRKWAARNKKEWARKMSLWNRMLPGIDLAHATATLLEFPSGAWPRAGRLLISGFTYQRAMPQGPLAPHRLADETTLSSKMKEKDWFWNFGAIGLFALGSVIIALVWWIGEETDLTLASLAALASLFFAASFYIDLPRVGTPNSVHIKPMAIEWLELQPPERNAYRTSYSLGSWLCNPWGCFRGTAKKGLGNLFRSLEPYTIAADALRREGRWISANLVEQERFRVRNWQLSWRTHFLQKSSFKAADWLTEYGYNYARVVFLSALAVVLAIMTTEKAYKCGAITPKDYTVIGVVAPAAQEEAPPKLECPGSPPKGQEDVDEVMFALDTVLPVTGVAESADWEVNKDTSALGGWAWEWARSIISYNRLLALFHIIGILLVGVLLLGLSTRFGQWLSRYGD